jgi:hypothetical protein
MKQLLDLCASIIEGTETPSLKAMTDSIWVESYANRVMIDSNDAVLNVTIKTSTHFKYTETTVNLKQYTDRPPVEVIEELTNIALKEWSECNSEYLIDNKIKNLLKK